MTRSCVRTVAFIAAIAFPAVQAQAQRTSSGLDPRKAMTQYVHASWQTDQGLPQNSVNALVQTENGYLWLGTQEGLVRFDGVRMTIFDRRNTPALQESWITGLAQTTDGSLWIATWGGGIVRLKDEVFTSYRTPEGLHDEHINTVVAHADGSLWIGSAHTGLIHYSGGTFSNRSIEAGLPHHDVTAIVSDTGGIWIGTSAAGIARFAGGSARTYDTRDGLASNTITALYRDDRGVLWIGTDRGLCRFEDGRFHTYTPRDGLPANRIRTIAGDSRGVLWVGTELTGITRFWNGRFSHYLTPDDLSKSTPIALQFDREGSLWIGTEQKGLHRLEDGRFTSYSTEEGLPAEVAWTVLASKEGGVWAGMETGGLAHVQNGRVRSYGVREGLTGGEVHALFEDPDGTLWIGTPAGLHRLSQGRITRFTTREPTTDIWAITRTRDEDLWLGTPQGVTRLSQQRVTTYGTEEGLGQNGVQALLQTRDGILYAGTGQGLYRLAGDGFVAVAPGSVGVEPAILALYEDAEGVLWAGTDGSGLHRIEGSKVTRYTSREGLPDDVVFSVLEDANHDLWMSSSKGVFQVAKAQLNAVAAGRARRLTSSLYGTADGMKIGEANGGFQPAGTRDSAGALWFPTLRGIAAIRPDEPRRMVPVRIHLEEIRVNADVVRPSDGLVLGTGIARLEFQYTALPPRNVTHLRFRYRLEGYDPRWIEAGSSRLASYTSVPGGRYHFRVEVLNPQGEWTQGLTFGFGIRHHFYDTTWFVALAATAIVLSGFGLHWFRLRRIRQREAELTELVGARTESLQQEIRERRDIEEALRRSHDELEERVQERTIDLGRANEALQRDIAHREEIEAEQSQLQVALRRSALEWKHTFDSIPSPVIITDLQGRIKRLNHRAGQLANMDSGDLLTREIGDLPGEPWHCAGNLVRELRSPGEGRNDQVRCRDTGRRWDVAATLVTAPTTADERVIIIARDVTAEVQLQESLRKSETMAAVSELVAGVAHEVRNPLFSISANLEAFEARHQVMPEARKYLEVLRCELNRLSSLMQDLVDYVKPPALHPVPVMLDQIVLDAIAACTPLAERHRVRTTCQVPRNLPPVMLDPERMTQVFTHLLSLALYHSLPGGLVEVEARMRSAERQWVECLLRDGGRERTAVQLPRGLMPFPSRDATRVGLGVSLVQLTIEQHGGTISATARPEGGTIVRILLPVTTA